MRSRATATMSSSFSSPSSSSSFFFSSSTPPLWGWSLMSSRRRFGMCMMFLLFLSLSWSSTIHCASAAAAAAAAAASMTENRRTTTAFAARTTTTTTTTTRIRRQPPPIQRSDSLVQHPQTPATTLFLLPREQQQQPGGGGEHISNKNNNNPAKQPTARRNRELFSSKEGCAVDENGPAKSGVVPVGNGGDSIPDDRRFSETYQSTSFSDSQSTSTSSSTSFSSLDGCCVTLTEPTTGCEVVLLGCFHGSQSSADDVVRSIAGGGGGETATDAIVLELCASRFADLRKELLNNDNQRQVVSLEQDSKRQQQQRAAPWWINLRTMVNKMSSNKGGGSDRGTAFAATLLGSVSMFQNALCGLEPGLEFTTALQVAHQNQIPIILADQDVDVTLRQLGSLPQRSLSYIRSIVSDIQRTLINNKFNNNQGDDDDESLTCSATTQPNTVRDDARALWTAIAGFDTKLVDPSQTNTKSTISTTKPVRLWKFMTRNTAAVRDLVRLVLPPFLLYQSLELLTSSIGTHWKDWMSHSGITTATTIIPTTMGFTAGITDATSDVAAATSSTSSVLGTVASLVVLTSFYAALVLPAVRVVLIERDEQLAEGILAACRLATAETAASSADVDGDSDSKPAGRVVAVLGLLHVNGVAQRLLSQQQDRVTE